MVNPIACCGLRARSCRAHTVSVALDACAFGDYFTGDGDSNMIWIIIALVLGNLCGAVYVAFSERRDPSSTVAWLLTILVIPLGLLLYLFFGRTPRTRAQFIPDPDFMRRATTRLVEQREQLAAHQLPDPLSPYRELMLTGIATSGALLTCENSVKILDTGTKYFEALIASLERAHTYIHLEVYIFRSDEIGQRILKIITEKARQGLDVKLIYDGTGSMGLSRSALEPLIRAGGIAVPFLPPLQSLLQQRINYRNHRKICVVDGTEAFLGGFNIGMEYLEGDPKLGFWRDLHIWVAGPAVERLELRFLMDWHYATKESIRPPEQEQPSPPAGGKTPIQIITSGPASHWAAIKYALLKMIQDARDHIYIETPYFMPDQALLDALKMKALAGVAVDIVIPSKPDHLFVQWANLSFCGELLEVGARVFTYQKGFLHSKLVTVDGAVASVGAANFDLRSFYVNFEITAIIYDGDLVSKLEDVAKQDILDSAELTLTEYQNRPWSTRAKEAFCRVLSPLM